MNRAGGLPTPPSAPWTVVAEARRVSERLCPGPYIFGSVTPTWFMYLPLRSA